MIDCCQLALYNGKLALYLGLGGFMVISFLLAMFFGYNLKWRKQQIELSQRTDQLEKKNGHEQKQIDQIKKEVQALKEKN